ncbi:MAG: PatB family C-S lyase [Candidatus Cloacimonas sp.]|jgi:cystathionine beta-lyase|nr:PatB family C-S lyase [Candidatus Cloacimonas sp.]
MQSRFDAIIDRKGSGCFKYDALPMLFGRGDLLSLWVADMDFAVSDEIQSALAERLKHPVFGYNLRMDDFSAAIESWQQKRFSWKISKDWLVAVPGIVPGISLAVLTLTNPGDGILIQTPVYRPFYDAVSDHERTLLCSPLINQDGHYTIDWDDFEAKLRQAKLFILCNPHNPVGRVWSRDELTMMGSLCRKHKVTIFSDEIHADLVYPGFKHIPIAALEDFGNFTITGVSPAKSFNIAGLATAVLVISNPQLYARVSGLNNKMHLYMGNSFGIRALIAAYRDSEAWLEEMLAYINGTRSLITDFVASELPGVILSPIESTYLAWLDFRAWGLDEVELPKTLVNQALLALDPGNKFGTEGNGFMRLNFGCPRSLVTEALERIKAISTRIYT